MPARLEESGERGLEEERRLAYVGLTRARKQAIVSAAANRRIYGNWSSSIPSRFLDELPAEHIQREGSTGMARNRVVDMPSVFTAGGLMARKPRTIEAGAWEVQARPAHAEPLQVGDRVFHKKFGYGYVTGVDDNKVDVNFEKSDPQAGDGQLPGACVMQPSDDRSAEGSEAQDRPTSAGYEWPTPLSRRRAEPLELLSIDGLPEEAVPASKRRCRRSASPSPISATSRPIPGGSRACARPAGATTSSPAPWPWPRPSAGSSPRRCRSARSRPRAGSPAPSRVLRNSRSAAS